MHPGVLLLVRRYDTATFVVEAQPVSKARRATIAVHEAKDTEKRMRSIGWSYAGLHQMRDPTM